MGHLRRALELAERGLYTTHPNPRVGCVISHKDAVVGEGWHVRAGGPHAEIMALQAAGDRARGAEVYVTLEPCNHTGRTAPCVDALIAAGVASVECCSADPNTQVAGRGFARLRSAGIQVSVGHLAAEARALNSGFFSRFERHRPFVRLKMAMSLDARTSSTQPAERWISSPASRADVQHWRARSSAILTGAGTVRGDDPSLNVRLDYGSWVRQPLRVLLDTMLTCSPLAKIFQGPDCLIFISHEAPQIAAATAVERIDRAGAGLDLGAVMARLAEHEVNELLVECGPTLAGALLSGGWVDELLLYVAPHFLGQNAAPLALLSDHDVASLKGAFEYRSVANLGNDIRVILAAKPQ